MRRHGTGSVAGVSTPAVSVVIAARDAAGTLPVTLAALADQEPAPTFEVLVVDDGSTDTTAAIAAAHPVVTAVLLSTGAGPGTARNVGIAAARAPVVAFTDADCAPAPGWLAAGLAALASGADVVQGRVDAAGPSGPWDRTVSVGGPSALYETANLFVRTTHLRAIGGFEPWLRPRRSKELGEDVWLGWRLRRAGARVAWAPGAVVHHAVFPRSPGAFLAERARVRFFPLMVRRIPELREALLWHGWFINRRQACFDLALLAVLAAGAGRRPMVLLLAGPYARELWRGARGAGRRRAPAIAAVHLAADAVSAGALAVGSARARALVA